MKSTSSITSPIYGPYSLEQPFGYTNFTFINVRTGQYQQAAAYVQ